MTINLLT